MSQKKTNAKSQRPVKQAQARSANAYDYQGMKNKYGKFVLITAVFLLCLFLVSVFKNIAHPLFWADESMTAMGSERVLQYGYPKVHDGKNVFYDLRHSDPMLGINEKDDAYVGGTGWAHYFYGIIGYKLAEKTDDLYAKTGIFRSTFAVAGILGLCLFVFFISKLLADAFSRYAFIAGFLLIELLSVSLALLLREVRYYSLVILLTSVILGLYTTYRFYRPFNKILLISVLSISLWILYHAFAPVYFIMIASIGLSELVIAFYQYRKSTIKEALLLVFPVLLAALLSLMAVFPLLSYFKTFEISRAMNAFNGYTTKMYWDNVSTVFGYFTKSELLWLAITLKLLVSLQARDYLKSGSSLFKASCFLSLYFLVYVFAIAKIPNFIYTRYIIYLQPVLAVIILLDAALLLKSYAQHSKTFISLKMMGLLFLITGFYLFTAIRNSENIAGHITELTNPYKGPLDYTIPYIKEKYPASDTLVIAANYEETSYMYYLKSKVIIGYTGNNLKEDTLVQPHIIAYRKPWGNYSAIFQKFITNAPYDPVKFPVKDSPVNTIPELNFKPAFNHPFETRLTEDDKEATYLYIRK